MVAPADEICCLCALDCFMTKKCGLKALGEMKSRERICGETQPQETSSHMAPCTWLCALYQEYPQRQEATSRGRGRATEP